MRYKAGFERKVVAVVAAVACAPVGSLLLYTSHAGTGTSSVEPENGAVGSTNIINDSRASGGKAIRFGSTSDTDKTCSQLTNLKFCDDFNGTSGSYPDNGKWNVFTSGSSWGSQCWRKTPENISMDGQGHLKMSVINTGNTLCTNSYKDASTYSSGGMDTSGRFTTKYGTIAVRAKLACADSIWGSIWLSTGSGPSWPQSGEIDIYELGYLKFYRLQQTVILGNSDSDYWHKATYKDLPTSQRWCDDWHVYGLDWRQNSLQFMVDGQSTARITPADVPAGYTWPFNDYDLRLLIDLQYGKAGRWTGDPNPGQLPTSMLVDWVRVYN